MDKEETYYQELVKKGIEHFRIEEKETEEFYVFENEEKKLKILGISNLLDTIASDAKKGKTRIIIDYDSEFPLCFVRFISQ